MIFLYLEQDYNNMSIYFEDKNFNNLDEEGRFYLHKSIAELKVNQSAQNPISYLIADMN